MSPVKRSLLFREVNERIYELLESADPDLPGEFLCECGHDCGERVELLPAAFATLRETGGDVRSPGCRGARLAVGVPALGQPLVGRHEPASGGDGRQGSVGLEAEPRPPDRSSGSATVDGEPRRNVVLASGASEEQVDEALSAAAGDARVALVSLLAGIDADAARSRLEASEGSVRKAAGK